MMFSAILLYFQSFNEFSDCDLNSDKKDHILDQSLGISEFGPPLKRARMTPPTTERVMLYVRQENEDVYTPLHVVPPTTIGLLNAVSCSLSHPLPLSLDQIVLPKTAKVLIGNPAKVPQKPRSQDLGT